MSSNLYKIVSVLISCLILHSYSTSQSSRVFPMNTVYQYEPLIIVSPLNPLIMFCSCNTYMGGSFFSEGVFVSTNGGLNWFGDDTCTGGNLQNHLGDPGIVIDKYGTFILKHIGQQPGVFSHYSTDMGLSWSYQYPISVGQSPEDKGSLLTDNIPSSPFYGRTYITGVNTIAVHSPVLFAYTTNSAMNWTSYSPINNNPPARCSGGELAIGPNGQVYDVWAGDTSDQVPSPENWSGFGISTNGGVNWSINQNIFSMHGIGSYYTFTSGNIITTNGIPRIAVDLSSGPRRGWIYVVTNEINYAPAGSDPDIIFHRSTDGGQTWSNGIRVNQDPLNNGKIQLFPAICVDSAGGIDIVYYDNRTTTSDSLNVYFSRSPDGGSTWYDMKVSDKTFQPKSVPGLFRKMGDFIGIASARNKLFFVWMADYTGIGMFQIWINIIDIPIGIQKISTNVPENYVLNQNYPNPFNPSTSIEFSIPKRDNVKLIIYDVLGHEVSNPVNSELSPGTYKITVDNGNLASGLYFYSLRTEHFEQTKKMILAK